MNVVGVTCAVGPIYAKLLARTLPVWAETLDRVVVMMARDDIGFHVSFERIRNVVKWEWTNAFTRNGAHFNKAAALNEGIAAAMPTDWVLAFDCDILPPMDWRDVAARNARRSCINGACRYTADGTPEDRRWYPRGYFQLWHVSSPLAAPFSESSGDAGGYDTEFADRWPQEHWNDLRFRLTHLGQKQKHWCGPGTTNTQMSEAVAAAGRRRRERRR